MTISQKVAEDLTNAMKSGDRARTEALRMVRSVLLELAKSGNEVTAESEVRALQNQAKRRKDAIEQFRAANRPELAEKEEIELRIIEGYLPQMMGDEEIAAEVRKIVAETGASGPGDFKIVMPKAMAALRGRADGAKVQAAVKAELEGKGA